MSFQAAQKQTDAAIARLIASQEKAIIREYAKSLQIIRAQLAYAYEKYGDRTALPFSKIAKYNRLASLEKQIFDEINKLTGRNAVKLKAALGEVYQETYYRTAFSLEREVQARLGFGQLNPGTIERAIANPLDRVGFLKRNRLNQDRLKAQLSSELTQGLIKGESYQQVARTIKSRMDTGATNTLRIAQTEMHRCAEQGRFDSFVHAEEQGLVLKKRWISAIDDRTRDDHALADGQVVDLQEPFVVGGEELMYPGDPAGSAENVINCRCSHIVEQPEFGPEFRRVRGEGIIPYKTFDEYKRERIAS